MSSETKEMTSKAQAAYSVYRDLGPTRTLKKTAELIGRSDRLVRGWSAEYNWVALAKEHDYAKLKEGLGEREVNRELVMQSIIDSMPAAAEKCLRIMTDDRKLPILDRQGQHMIDEAGRKLYRPLVKASTQLEAAKLLLGIGGAVPVKRTETIDRSGEELDEVAAMVAKLTPAQVLRVIEALESGNPEST